MRRSEGIIMLNGGTAREEPSLCPRWRSARVNMHFRRISQPSQRASRPRNEVLHPLQGVGMAKELNKRSYNTPTPAERGPSPLHCRLGAHTAAAKCDDTRARAGPSPRGYSVRYILEGYEPSQWA